MNHYTQPENTQVIKLKICTLKIWMTGLIKFEFCFLIYFIFYQAKNNTAKEKNISTSLKGY